MSDALSMEEACALVGSLMTRVEAGDGPIVAAWCSRVAARLWVEGGGVPSDLAQMHRTHLQLEARRQAAKHQPAESSALAALVAWAQMDGESRYLLGLASQWVSQRRIQQGLD